MRIAIAGAGIIGSLIAYELNKEGYEVILIDGGDIRKAASWGNAGFLSPAFGPLSPTRGEFKDLIKWSFSTSSVTKIRIKNLFKNLKWIYKFLKESKKTKEFSYIKLIREMAIYGEKFYEELTKKENIYFDFRKDGLLEVYLKNEEFEKRIKELKNFEMLKIPYKILNYKEIKEIEPSLSKEIIGGIFYPEENLLDPRKLIKEIRNILENRIKFIKEDVIKIKTKNNLIESFLTNKNEIKADEYIVATGAWKNILKKINIKIPLIAGRGYAITTSKFKGKILHHLLCHEYRIAVSQVKEGNLRISGYFEVAEPDDKPKENYFKFLFKKSKIYINFKELKIEDKWIGSRPCIPDMLPVIGRVKKYKNLIIATGHCRLGITLSPYTSMIVKKIIKGEKINIGMLSPLRFRL